MIEILIVVLLLILCVWLIRVNFFTACVLALVFSTFLHKELFSIYIWDLLPIRILMGAFLINSFYEFIKWNRFSLKFINYLKDPLVLFSVLFLISKFVSTINTLDFRTSFFLNIFYLASFNFVLTIYFKYDARNLLELYKKYFFIAFIVCLIPFIQIYLYFNNSYLFGAILNVAGLNVDFPSFSFEPSFFSESLKLIVMTRLGSIFWDVNHFGGFLALLFSPAIALILSSKSKDLKKNSIYFIFIGIAIFLTNSRSAWMLAFISLCVFLLLLVYKKIGRKGVIYSFVFFSALSLLLFSMYQDRDSLFREKVRSYFHYRMDSFDSHFLLLQGASDVFAKYPFIGGGTGSFFEHFKETPTSNEFLKRDPAGLSSRVPAHSIWGEVLAESGGFGLFAFLGLILIQFGVYIYALNHTNNSTNYQLYSSFLGSLIGLLVAGVFYSYNSEFYFILLFLPLIYTLKNEKISFEELFTYFKHKNLYLKILVFLISFGLLFFALGDTRLITFDESIYGKVAKNVYETGDYLTLRWRSYDDLWFEKPPLYFIITAYFYEVLGVSEFSTRLAVVLFSILGLIYTYKLAKILFKSSYVGIFAVFGLILNVSYLYYSRIGMLDVILTSLIVGSTYYFIKYSNSSNILDLILSGTFIGLAVLTKSIVGFLPLTIFGVYYLINKFLIKQNYITIKSIVIITLISFIIALPWHLHMYQVHGQKFIDSYVEYHLLQRFTSEIEDKGAPWYFYLVVIRNTMRIWYLIFIPAVVWFTYKLVKVRFNSNQVILIIASLVTLVFFSASSSKLKWYIMPIYPFLYIICGYFVYYVFNLLVKFKQKFSLISLFLLSFIFFNLAYLYLVKDMVYTSNFNKKQAEVLIRNNTLIDIEITYIDKVDYPVALFYNEVPNPTFLQFSDLKEVFRKNASNGKIMSVVTGKSRFEILKREVPGLRVIQENDDFVVGVVNYLNP